MSWRMQLPMGLQLLDEAQEELQLWKNEAVLLL